MSGATTLVVIVAAGAGGYWLYTEQQRALAAQEAAFRAQLLAQRDDGDSFGDQLKASALNVGVGLLGNFLGNAFGGNSRGASAPIPRASSTPAPTTTGGGLGNILGNFLGSFGAGNIASASPDGGAVAGQLDLPPAGQGTGGLLALIGSVEAPKGYDQVYGGISRRDQPPRPLTTMTVDEVLAWQDSIDPRYQSEAAGRYQVLEDTLRGLRDSGQVSGSALFNARTQDHIGNILLERRGLSDFRAGRISQTQFGQNLSQEWASLPALTRDRSGRTATGQSYYAGDGLNRAHVTISRITDALRSL